MKHNLENMRESEKKTKEIIYKCFSVLIYLLVFVILIYLFINEITSIKISGYEAFVIVSESMEPQINTGDIVIIKPIPEKDIKVGSVITFEKNNEYITHRVTKIENEENKKLYTTKGDNNKVEDLEKTEYSQIKGIQVGKIPFIGKLVLKASNQKVIIIVLILVILLYRRAKKIDNKKKGRRKKKKIEDERYIKSQENNQKNN